MKIYPVLILFILVLCSCTQKVPNQNPETKAIPKITDQAMVGRDNISYFDTIVINADFSLQNLVTTYDLKNGGLHIYSLPGKKEYFRSVISGGKIEKTSSAFDPGYYFMFMGAKRNDKQIMIRKYLKVE